MLTLSLSAYDPNRNALDGQWCNAKGSFPLDVRRLDNRRPASDVTLHEGGERLLTAARLVWDFQDNVEKPLAHVLVVQSLVEGIGEFVECRFRRRLGSTQRQ